MEYITTLPAAVTGFSVAEACIDCICGKELMKLDRRSGEVVRRKEIFQKEGFSRNLVADEEQIFIYDFCTLYALRRSDFEPLGQWQLGDDVSSDICGLAVDQDAIYCAIRNGGMITLDRRSYEKREVQVLQSSMWSVKPYARHLVCGTVDGRVLLLDKATLAIEGTLELGKKNVGSLYLCGETLYAASHDGKLFKIDMQRFEVEAVTKNAHRKMFHCVGVYRGRLLTVSYPCSQLAWWDANTLEKRRVMEIPLQLSGRAEIRHDRLYISSRNLSGIGVIRLDA